MFKWLKDIYYKEKVFPPRERMVAYVPYRGGKVIMWPERIDPEYAKGCYGLYRLPHLDEPKEK